MTIVTPSPLIAAFTAQQFTKYRLGQGQESWQRMPIYTVDAWLKALWNEARYRLAGVPTLLSGSQEHLVWQQIIEETHPHLFNIASTAQLARRTANLMAEWHIPADAESWSEHEDARQFQEWYKLFHQRCREKCWIARSDLWRLIPNWIAAGVCARDTTVFTGFQNFAPALERVTQVLGDRFVREDARAGALTGKISGKVCADFAQEIEHAARWSRAMFEQRPAESIGIFVPGLAAHRSLIERTFQQVFYPSAVLRSGDATQGEVHSVFHVHAAIPLRTHPLIASALLLLELARSRIHITDAGAILRNPFIAGAAAERNERALADLELRKTRELDVSLADLEFATRHCPLLARLWTRLRSIPSRDRRKLEFSSWSEYFARILEALDWPGEAQLTAQEQEMAETWNNALSKLAALGLVSGPVSSDAALAHLRRLLSVMTIGRSDFSAPIQILDASQAAGLEFDRAFVTGLSDETWPPALEIHPLIPLNLQRVHHVPASSPHAAQAERERMTRNLFSAADSITATYSGRLSGLAARFVTPERVELAEWQGRLPRQSYVPAALLEVDDTNAPPYEQNEGTRGGVSLIKAQSLCPFRAFAEFRLAAKTPEEGCLGFDSRERGGFVHDALQKVWNRIRTHRQLLAMPREELLVLVRDAVEDTVNKRESEPFHELMSRAECERLQRVILEWLDFERTRKQSFIVETLEQKRLYDFPGLRLQLRVDRLDRLSNGKLVLIDYKSGPQTRGKLKCPRPAEPQLLVYATAVGNEVDGIFFGELKPREPRAVGFSREKHFSGSAAEVRRDWSIFLDESQAEVQRLAAEFVHGYAAVHPLKGACEYCSVKPLCRVNEDAPQEQDSE